MINPSLQQIVDSNKKYFPTPLQEFMYLDKYSRWIPELKRREIWEETVARVIKFLFKNCRVSYTGNEWAEMETAMMRLDVMPSMRSLDDATPIPTPSGWRTVGNIRTGDVIFGSDGNPCTVLATQKFSDIQLFEIQFSDDARIVASGDHLWKVSTIEDRRYGRTRVVSTDEIMRNMYLSRGPNDKRCRYNYCIWNASPLNLPEAVLPLDPYILGMWLGDGFSHGGQFSCDSKDTELVSAYTAAGFNGHKVTANPHTWGTYNLEGVLRTMGLLDNKYVPDVYLRASIGQRLALLQGLMDTDGCTEDSGRSHFCNTNPRIIAASKEILASLGVKYIESFQRANENENLKPTWVLSFFTEMDVHRLPRKASNLRVVSSDRTEYRTITKISPIGKGNATCFEVNSPDNTYLAGRKMVVTHNCVQMAGPALERDNTGAYNCAFAAIDSLDSFGELLYILMQGTGIGYSVEDRYVSRLPRVKKQRRGKAPDKHVIPDSTEGWCNAFKLGLNTWFSGYDIEFDFSQIRPAGSILATKGGRASGPQPLKELLAFVRSTVLTRQGKKLSPLDCHDIACYCGFIVQVGGVRRAALISLSDFEDTEIAQCKNGEFWNRFPYRSMSNNSGVYEEKPSAVDFMEEWINLAKSGTGERGIFNRECAIPDRRKRMEFGMNPCGEIILRNNQYCNLSICVARENDSILTLAEKVRIATMFGTAQATLTHFPYLNPRWKKNCEEEMLLGVDITGQRDCRVLQTNTNAVLSYCRQTAIDMNKLLSERFGLNQSAAVTCVKPSGNSSQFLDCASGLHARYAPYYIRRVRVGAYTPVAKLLKDAGVPCFPETGQSTET